MTPKAAVEVFYPASTRLEPISRGDVFIFQKENLAEFSGK
jgi:hypothetical protein